MLFKYRFYLKNVSLTSSFSKHSSNSLIQNNIPSYNFATFKDKVQKKQKEQSEQEFRKQLEFLVNKPTYTLADYKQTIVDSLEKLKKGLRAKLMRGNEETEADLIKKRTILNAFMDDELLDDTKIKWQQKTDIATVSQTKVSDINQLMVKYEYMKNMHTWLRGLKERGEDIPATQDELTYRFRKDRPISKNYIRFQMKRNRNSRKQMRQRIKWGPRKQL